MSKIVIRQNLWPAQGALFSWALPAIVVLLMVAGAIGSLVAGLAAPELMGADGMARIALPAR